MSLLIIAAGLTFICTPTATYDGDGPIWCAEGPKIRLAGIAAREMDGTCQKTQPCPDATAEKARDTLVRLIGAPTGKLATGHITLAASAVLAAVPPAR